ncbi:hypothetical protein [Allosphingosinicella sp.]|jgi:hypothetical protein|uniref:hypothetical protein n=1 Tax=Allosphingosinicella sp. TaxID=2823234 RepID=UPI002EF258DE
MQRVRHYILEVALLAAVILVSVGGFWNIYFGTDADPQPHHHLHLATVFIWMSLLLAQLILIMRRSYQAHRKIGLAVLIAGPLLVATTAMLAVRSAQKGAASGEGDFMIVQNTMATLELGLLIFLAFLLKNRRKLHGSLLLSTTIVFMGIALFFALTSFVPPFRTGSFDPTFDGFQLAGTAGQVTCLAVGFLFFIRDPKNGWPFLAAGFCFPFNDAIYSLLTSFGLINPLTDIVGSMSQPLTFIAIFALLFSLLAATALPRRARISGSPVHIERPAA